VEVDVCYLDGNAAALPPQKPNIAGYRLSNGREIFVLAEGRLVNLASGDGHPAEIMDMSFAIQALSAAYLAANKDILRPGIVPVPEDIDLEVARRKLRSGGIAIDSLSPEQERYLSGWVV
jgi:adenosylhomocysteinase